MIEKGRFVPKTSLGQAVSLTFAKKCRKPKTWPNSWMSVSICSFRDWLNILGYIVNACRPASGKKALANVHPPPLHLSVRCITISKSHTSVCSVNRIGQESPHAIRASPINIRRAAFAASGRWKLRMEFSLNRHLRFAPCCQSGINPSLASSLISSGERFRGVAYPRLSVIHIDELPPYTCNSGPDSSRGPPSSRSASSSEPAVKVGCRVFSLFAFFTFFVRVFFVGIMKFLVRHENQGILFSCANFNQYHFRTKCYQFRTLGVSEQVSCADSVVFLEITAEVCGVRIACFDGGSLYRTGFQQNGTGAGETLFLEPFLGWTCHGLVEQAMQMTG